MSTPTATIFVPYHALDELIQRGTRAAQPAASAVTPGTLYSVSDEGNRIERSSGTAWEAYSPSGGGTATFSFDYSSTGVAPPTSNQIRFNALHPYTAVTTLWIRTVTTDGADVQTFLLLIPTGSTVYVQDKNDHTLYARFTTTAATIDHGTYVEVPVTWVANGGALLNNQAVEVLIVTGGGGGGGAPDPHHTTHEPGGSDAITALDAGVLTTGTITSARLPPYYDYLEGTPANPAADTLRMYAVDYNGFTFLEERDSAGRTIRTSRDTVAVGKVDEAGGITRGQCVYVSGASGANRLLKKALATSRATTPAFGLAMESGAQNTFIRILTSGLLTDLDTSAIAEGARVFLSETTPGALTVTAPLAPNFVQRVGWVLRQHAVQGEIGVLPATALSEASWVATHASMHAVGGRDPLTLTTLAGYPGGTTTFLRADGSFAAPSGTAPGGSTTQVQFNDAGAFGGDAGLVYDKTTDALTVSGVLNLHAATFHAADIFFTADKAIARNTSDGSDTGFIQITGGGGSGSSRGGHINLFGNEHAVSGAVQAVVGNVAGSYFGVLDIASNLVLKVLGSNGQSQFRSSASGDFVIMLTNTSANPIGMGMFYNTVPNDAAHVFMYCADATNARIELRSNGGIANYQANDVNVSDAGVKEIAGPADIERGRFTQLQFVRARYKDAPYIPNDVMLTAQDVQKVYPDLVGEFADGHLGVREHGILMRGLKVVQEHDVLIDRLMARVTALEERTTRHDV